MDLFTEKIRNPVTGQVEVHKFRNKPTPDDIAAVMDSMRGKGIGGALVGGAVRAPGSQRYGLIGGGGGSPKSTGPAMTRREEAERDRVNPQTEVSALGPFEIPFYAASINPLSGSSLAKRTGKAAGEGVKKVAKFLAPGLPESTYNLAGEFTEFVVQPENAFPGFGAVKAAQKVGRGVAPPPVRPPVAQAFKPPGGVKPPGAMAQTMKPRGGEKAASFVYEGPHSVTAREHIGERWMDDAGMTTGEWFTDKKGLATLKPGEWVNGTGTPEGVGFKMNGYTSNQLSGYLKVAEVTKKGVIATDPVTGKRYELTKASRLYETKPGAFESHITAAIEHRKAVEQAIADGKPIPAEVLAAYPDLGKTAKVAEPSANVPTGPTPKPGVQGPVGIKPPVRASSQAVAPAAYEPTKGGILYREASPDEFLTSGYRDQGKFFSDNPDLAIGQGKNKGVIYEVEFPPASETANIKRHAKPGTDMEGVGKEYVIGNRQATSDGRAVGTLKSITIKKGTKLSDEAAYHLQIYSKEGPNQLYVRETVPEGVRYRVLSKQGELYSPATPEGATGLARRFEDPERVAQGKQKLPSSPQSPQALADRGRKLVESGEVQPAEVLDRVVNKGGAPSFEKDIPAVLYRKALVRDEKAKLLSQPPSPQRDFALNLLDKETEQISLFAGKAQEQFHGTGMALQGAYGDDMAFVSLRDEAMGLNFGERISPKIEAELQDLSQKWAAAQSELDALKAQIAEGFKAPRTGGGNPAKMRAGALNRLRSLGIDAVEAEKVGGGIPGKQAGAVNIPAGTVNDQVGSAVRQLANSYIREGVTDIDEILKRFSADVPGMSHQDFLSALSPQARKMRSDATVASIQARRVMTKVRRQAEFRMKSNVDKALAVSGDILKNFQRTVQASFDASAALLQGKPALMARPGSWLKGWGDLGRAALAHPTKALEVQDRIWADLMQDPVIREGVEQGWLNLRAPNGAYSAQEEIFRGQIAHYIPGVARSDAMFSSQLNAIYGDWYRKLVAINPGDAQYKQGVAAMMNIMSGRGHGKVADMLGHESMGWFGYAPKYAYSIAQLGTGTPIRMGGIPGKARWEAAKAYAGILTSMVVMTKAAKMFGWEVDNDPRSVNFGMARGPDGRMVDAYNKVTQFPRMLWQAFYGKVGARGQYKEPGDFGFEPLMDYIHNNFSPQLRDLEMISTGKMWDQGEGKFRDAGKSDLFWTMAPLGVQDLRTMKKRDALDVALSFFGGRPKQAEPRKLEPGEKRAPTWKLAPPGPKRILKN